MSNSKIKVLIADDHHLVRSGIKHMLSEIESITIIGEASDGEEAIRLARQNSPHVVLMDLKMPGIGGLEATRKLLRSNPEIKVLIVTVCDDNLFPSKLLEVGAAGYITKDSNLDEMVHAIKSVHKGERYINPKIAQSMILQNLSTTDDSSSLFSELSQRELQVAVMIAGGQKPQDIATKLNLCTKTVNSYRYRIYKKLNINNDVELTRLAIRYKLVDT